MSLRPSWRRLYVKHRNSLVMLLKNASAARLPWVLPVRLALEVLTLAALARGEWQRPAAALAGVGWTLAHPMSILRRRKQAQRVRRVGDAAVAERMYRGSLVWAYYVRGRKTALEILGEAKG